MTGTVDKLMAAIERAENLARGPYAHAHRVIYKDRGTEMERDIRKRARNVLVEIAQQIIVADEKPSVAVQAVKLLLELRAQLCQSEDETI